MTIFITNDGGKLPAYPLQGGRIPDLNPEAYSLTAKQRNRRLWKEPEVALASASAFI